MQLKSHAEPIAVVPLFDVAEYAPQPVIKSKSESTAATVPIAFIPAAAWNQPIDVEDAEDLFDDLAHDLGDPALIFTTDEQIELHKVLLQQSCEQFGEALTNRDTRLLQDIWSWLVDTSYRAFSFRVCAAISEVDPEVFLFQMKANLLKLWPNFLQESSCSPTTNCYPMRVK